MTTKTCSKCNEVKPAAMFHNNKSRADGKSYNCKPCTKVINKTSLTKPDVKSKLAKYHRAKRLALTRVEVVALDSVRLARHRPTSLQESTILYGGLTFTEAVTMTLPFAEERLRLEALTGIPHHIDHIISIKDGGTHTADNLQVLTASENISKG